MERADSGYQYASILAEIYEKDRITLALLKQSCQMMASQQHPEELLETQEPEEEPQTHYERESELRNDARANKEKESA